MKTYKLSGFCQYDYQQASEQDLMRDISCLTGMMKRE